MAPLTMRLRQIDCGNRRASPKHVLPIGCWSYMHRVDAMLGVTDVMIQRQPFGDVLTSPQFIRHDVRSGGTPRSIKTAAHREVPVPISLYLTLPQPTARLRLDATVNDPIPERLRPRASDSARHLPRMSRTLEDALQFLMVTPGIKLRPVLRLDQFVHVLDAVISHMGGKALLRAIALWAVGTADELGLGVSARGHECPSA